jgi:hypothetical protein
MPAQQAHLVQPLLDKDAAGRATPGGRQAAAVPWDVVEPGASMPFAWDKPTLKHSVIVQARPQAVASWTAPGAGMFTLARRWGWGARIVV